MSVERDDVTMMCTFTRRKRDSSEHDIFTTHIDATCLFY